MNTNTNTYTEPVGYAGKKCHNGHHDRLSGIVKGIIFVLAGAWILIDMNVFLDTGWFWWFLFSAGIVLLGETAIRMIYPQFSARINHSLIWGAIFATIGALHIFDIGNFWPLAFILVGIIMILQSHRHVVKQSA